PRNATGFPYCFRAASSRFDSWMHGVHHDAQKSSTIGFFPLSDARSMLPRPSMRERSNDGAVGCLPWSSAFATVAVLSCATRQIKSASSPTTTATASACSQPNRARHQAATMKTVVPLSPSLNSHSACGMCMRMQPCETEYPIDASDGVPWMPTPGADKPIQRVPSGLFGPGGIGCCPCAHGELGGYHQGFFHLTMIVKRPSGVGYWLWPVATVNKRHAFMPL